MFTFDAGQHHLLPRLPDEGDFIFLELEVLLLLRNALVTN
jgi:hypothetical protein